MKYLMEQFTSTGQYTSPTLGDPYFPIVGDGQQPQAKPQPTFAAVIVYALLARIGADKWI